jgi:hypothetical protein
MKPVLFRVDERVVLNSTYLYEFREHAFLSLPSHFFGPSTLVADLFLAGRRLVRCVPRCVV